MFIYKDIHTHVSSTSEHYDFMIAKTCFAAWMDIVKRLSHCCKDCILCILSWTTSTLNLSVVSFRRVAQRLKLCIFLRSQFCYIYYSSNLNV